MCANDNSTRVHNECGCAQHSKDTELTNGDQTDAARKGIDLPVCCTCHQWLAGATFYLRGEAVSSLHRCIPLLLNAHQLELERLQLCL
jgi:hypothetical protein